MTDKKKPTCDRRKPCEFCGKQYGRKAYFLQDGLWRLEPISKWKASECCSLKCKNELSRQRAREWREETKRQQIAQEAAMSQFLGTPMRVPE